MLPHLAVNLRATECTINPQLQSSVSSVRDGTCPSQTRAGSGLVMAGQVWLKNPTSPGQAPTLDYLFSSISGPAFKQQRPGETCAEQRQSKTAASFGPRSFGA